MPCGNQKTAGRSQFFPSTLLREYLSCFCHCVLGTLSHCLGVLGLPVCRGTLPFGFLGTKLGCQACAVSNLTHWLVSLATEASFLMCPSLKASREILCIFRPAATLVHIRVPQKKPTVELFSNSYRQEEGVTKCLSKVTLSIQAGPSPSPHGQCPGHPVRTFLPKAAVAPEGLAGQMFYVRLPHIRLSGLSHKL